MRVNGRTFNAWDCEIADEGDPDPDHANQDDDDEAPFETRRRWLTVQPEGIPDYLPAHPAVGALEGGRA